jgi:hypothetical protein
MVAIMTTEINYTPVGVVIDQVRELSIGQHVWVPAKTSLHALRVSILRRAKQAGLAVVTQKAIKNDTEGLKVYRISEKLE